MKAISLGIHGITLDYSPGTAFGCWRRLPGNPEGAWARILTEGPSQPKTDGVHWVAAATSAGDSQGNGKSIRTWYPSVVHLSFWKETKAFTALRVGPALYQPLDRMCPLLPSRGYLWLLGPLTFNPITGIATLCKWQMWATPQQHLRPSSAIFGDICITYRYRSHATLSKGTLAGG